MKRAPAKPATSRRVLILVDESNVTSSAKAANRKLDWLELQEFLLDGRELIETVIYAGLPPAMPEWQVNGILELFKMFERREPFCQGSMKVST